MVTRPYCGYGDRSERRSARRQPSQLISTRGGGSQGENPYQEETWARLAARASELRVRSNSWRAWRCKPRTPTLALPALSGAIGSRQLKDELDGSMPEPFEKGRDKESRPN
eukprot:6191154-Pleurochrysis_carterae.AAC.1